MNNKFRSHGWNLSRSNTLDILLVTLVVGFVLRDIHVGYHAGANANNGFSVATVRPSDSVIPECLKVSFSPKDRVRGEAQKSIPGTTEEKQLAWIFLLPFGTAAIVAAPTLVVLSLHGFRSRTGFSLNQQVLIELVQATNVSIPRVLCIGCLFARYLLST